MAGRQAGRQAGALFVPSPPPPLRALVRAFLCNLSMPSHHMGTPKYIYVLSIVCSSPQGLHLATSHTAIHPSRIKPRQPLALLFTENVVVAPTPTSAPSPASRSIEHRLPPRDHQPHDQVADAVSQTLCVPVDRVERQILGVPLAVVADQGDDDVRDGAVERGCDECGQEEDLVRPRASVSTSVSSGFQVKRVIPL